MLKYICVRLKFNRSLGVFREKGEKGMRLESASAPATVFEDEPLIYHSF